MNPISRIVLAASLSSATLWMSGSLHAGETKDDSWGVRLSGQGIESFSDVNIGKPSRIMPFDVRAVAARERDGMSIELRADVPTATRLQGPGIRYGPELDQALEAMARLHPRKQPRAKMIVTLIDPGQHVRARRVHGRGQGTVVDLFVPLAMTPEPLSVGVGKAMAIALHEISHAFSAASIKGKALSRSDDEYRASLVESCYLIDTMRVGDNLRLLPRQGAGADEYFVTAQSRDAARDVVADLVRASGTDSVRWDDNVALLGLKLACGVRLAQPM